MAAKARYGLRLLGWLLISLAVLGFVKLASMQFYRSAYPRHYAEFVTRYSAEFGVEESLLYAVIRTESSFRPDATSSIGARGLMQLTEETFDWVKSRLEPEAETSYEEMYDPETNIRYGACLLSLLLQEFGSVSNALCAYHAGWGNAKQWLADPAYASDGRIHTIPFRDTAFYVHKVEKTADIYARLY